jgi:hypothetical protein
MGGSLSTIQRQQIATIRLKELNSLQNKNEIEQYLDNQIELYYPEKREEIINQIIAELEINPDNVLDTYGMILANSIFVRDIIIKYNQESEIYKQSKNQLSNKKKLIMNLYSSRPLRFRKYDE